jgi:hypothetical protein
MAISQGGGTLWAFGPTGMPSAVRRSSVSSPGFFSFSLKSVKKEKEISIKN